MRRGKPAPATPPRPSRAARRLAGAVLVVALAVSGCGGAGRLVQSAERIAAGEGSSIDDIVRVSRGLRTTPADELATTAAHQRELLQQLDAVLVRAYAGQLDEWAAGATRTADGAADDARNALLVTPTQQFLDDLRAAAKEEVKSAVCDELQSLLFPTKEDEQDDPGQAMAEKVITALSRFGPRAVQDAVDWALWGRDAAKRVDQAVTSLNDYPDRLELSTNQVFYRSVVAKERFCDPAPGHG